MYYSDSAKFTGETAEDYTTTPYWDMSTTDSTDEPETTESASEGSEGSPPEKSDESSTEKSEVSSSEESEEDVFTTTSSAPIVKSDAREYEIQTRVRCWSSRSGSAPFSHIFSHLSLIIGVLVLKNNPLEYEISSTEKH